MTRLRPLILTAALTLAVVVAAIFTTQTASAATVPDAPASCGAVDVGAAVDVSWTPPPTDGGAPIVRYVVKIKGQATPVVQVNDPTARIYRWTTAYASSSVFQVRAVNSVGFGAWCETPIGGTSPSPSPTPTATASPTPTATATPTPPAGELLYEAGSYLYSSPSQYGAIDPAATTAMRNFMATFVDQKAIPYPKLNGLGSNAWGMVYAVGTASDPIWHLSGSSVDPRLAPSGAGFHAPANLGQRITGTTDSPMVVVDLASGITVAAQKVAKTTTCCTLTVGPGDYFTHNTNGLDTARPESDCDNLGKHCKASRGRIPDSMLVTAGAMNSAVANHTDLGYTLEIFWPETDSSAGFKLPMTGAEGSKAGWGAEGQRIGIDPTINLGARTGCTAKALVIALTLQRHGAYIGDNAGGGAALKMEQNSAADPTSSGAFSGMTVDSMKGCVTWSDFVAYTTPK